MQSAGDLVALAAELAAGVQHGEHDLGRALALVRTGRVRIDRDAASVVVDAAAAVGEQRDPDPCREAGHRLVDGVVDDLPDEVMEAGETGRADVHPGALADGVETLQNLDVLGPVIGRWLVAVSGHADLCASRRRSAEAAAVTWVFRVAIDGPGGADCTELKAETRSQ